MVNNFNIIPVCSLTSYVSDQRQRVFRMVLLKTKRLKKEMNRIDRALGWYSKGFMFDSRRGQIFFQLVLCAMEHF